MTIDTVLDRLGHIRQNGRDQWMARCCAHEDRSASLSVRTGRDGRVLVHCFAGCEPSEIVAAIGLQLSDLFPPPEGGRRSRAPRWHGVTASQALAALAFEVTFVGMCASDLAAGKALEAEDRARLSTAIGRITTAEEICRG